MNDVDFKRFFYNHYSFLVRVATFYLGNVISAEDVVQDVFVRLIEKDQLPENVLNVEAFLVRIVKNDCINLLKHTEVVERYQKKILEEYDDTPNDEVDDSVALMNEVYSLVCKLPDKRRHIFKMSVLDSMSYAQIASSMDISVNTVKDHIKKAYAFIRSNLKKNI